MTVREAIALANELRANDFSENMKVQWLNEAEGMVQTKVMLLKDDDLVRYSWEENADTELCAKYPHDKLYWTYLCAMIDYANGDEDTYQNDITLFNERFSEFTKWYTVTYSPADGMMEARLYYLTAYSIALKHGFVGSEEQFASMLIAPVTLEEAMRHIDETAEAANQAVAGAVEEVSAAKTAAEKAAEDAYNHYNNAVDKAEAAEEYAAAAAKSAEDAKGEIVIVNYGEDDLYVVLGAYNAGKTVICRRDYEDDGGVWNTEFYLLTDVYCSDDPPDFLFTAGTKWAKLSYDFDEGLPQWSHGEVETGGGGSGGKGEKGDKGDPGYTPVRGVDYWTPTDIAEIKGYVDDAILGGAW